ncbi:MAG: MarR family transcriptional regulator [Myxococcales bacterium]|nr:MarR family transcriptional regulator [Myxococcales bacterium]
MDAALDPLGLTTPQYAALSALEAAPGLSNAELARRSFVTPQTMIRVLSTLEERALVVRAPHPIHRRVRSATLTAKGRRAVDSCRARAQAIEEEMLADLNPRARARLRGLLVRCAEALERGGA